MKVSVVDKVEHSADVSPAQAVAYCRRVLSGWRERTRSRGKEGPIWAQFERSDPVRSVLVPLRDDYADFGERMAELCSELVALGIVRQPSEALLAMAREVTPAAVFAWLECERWKRVDPATVEDGWRVYTAPIRDDRGVDITVALPEDVAEMIAALDRRLPLMAAVALRPEVDVMAEIVAKMAA